jgi:dethiobiotin synthetase
LKPLFITSTDTDAGKTVLVSALAAYWQAHCLPQRLAIYKPLQSGEGDREHYQQLLHLGQSLAEINPLYFQAPLAPPLAADLEERRVDLSLAWNGLQALQQTYDWVLVEGVGGLGSPVTHELTNADLVKDWDLPALLVVPVRLGAIGQAVANVALARQHNLRLLGIVLNCTQPCTATDIDRWAAPELIANLTQTPVLGVLPNLENSLDLQQLVAAASDLMLEAFFPLASR